MKIGLALLASLVLHGCSSGMKAGLLTVQNEVMPSRSDVRKAALHPQYRYLLVETDGQEALMVWTGNEPHRLGQARVWVSADGVIVRTVNGRVVGVSEPRRQWELVSETPALPSSPSTGTRLLQTSDAQPGFRTGMVRTIEQTTLPAAQQPASWFDQAPQLHWLQEIDPTSGERLALYGLNMNKQTVAGQRCMTAQWCLRWQSWPANSDTSTP